MKYSDKYKANAFMVAGLSCVTPLGSLITNLREHRIESNWDLMATIAYLILALYGLVLVYVGYQESKLKEELIGDKHD